MNCRLEIKKKSLFEKIKYYKHKEIIAFILVMFIFYLSTLSCSWDDEDGILFIRGVKEFDVTRWQPHPPGYPIYIFLGKISVFLIGEELLGLTILSAIFGALSLVVFYFLIFEMYDKKIALMSTMILGVTPLFWLNSLKAMTDIPGLFFILLSMYFIYHFIKYKNIKSLYIGSFVSALSAGLRFHSLFVAVPLLIYACFKIIRREVKTEDKKTKKRKLNKNQKQILYCLIFFFLGILAWLVPMLILNGFFGYFEAASRQFFKRFNDPGMATVGGELSLSYLSSRIKDLFRFFLGSSYGLELWKFDTLSIIAGLFYLFFLLLSYKKLKNKKIMFFVIGLFFYIIMVFLFLPIHNSRYLLPAIPVISLLFAFGILWFGKYYYLGFIFLIFLLLFFSVPLAKTIHETIAPPIQLVNYINANYNLDKIIIFKDNMIGRHLRYYGIDSYSSFQLRRYLSNGSISDENANRTGRISAVFDKDKAILIINPGRSIAEYNLTLVKKFDRDVRAHEKHSSISLYELNSSF